jgi:type VI secretion system protein ImpK
VALVDRFLPAAAFAALLAREPQMGDVPFETARADLDRLLTEAVDAALDPGEGYQPEEVQDALFAVCAFSDEAVLASSWPGRTEWLKQPLQRLHFDTANAGEEFYVRLAALCDLAATEKGLPGESGLFEDPDRRAALREVLEVYAACLTLGFTGRHYGDKGRERLAAITRASLDRLMVRGPALGDHLFPEAYTQRQPAPPPSRLKSALALLTFLGVPLLTALYLHAAYASLLAAWVRDWLSVFT